MTLNNYLKNVVADEREKVRYTTIEVWKTSQTADSTDAYGRSSSISSGAGYFSGSIGWGRTRQRADTAGGWYNTGDLEISASLSYKTGASYGNLENNDIYLVVEGQSVKIRRIIEASETKDMLIYCEILKGG